MSEQVVVVGLGYVGLPLALAAHGAGYDVAGYDRHAGTVAALRTGTSHVDGVTERHLAEYLSADGVFTDDPSVLAGASIVVICVPTPLKDGSPDLSAIEEAASVVASQLESGALVVLESTTYPGTTEEVLVPILEGGSGLTVPDSLLVAYSPERIDPGNERWNLGNTPKIVGGVDDRSLRRAVFFYESFVSKVVPASSVRAAEMAKLLENTYRHVNIALVNELALVADDLGVDIFEVIGLASSKPFGFQPFYPGPGVGGHCIPIDPHYLSYRLRSLGRGFRFVELAREINDSMPAFVALRAIEVLNRVGKPVSGSRIVVAGVAYKPGVGDTRETPAVPVLRRLLALGAEIVYVDPHVSSFSVDGTPLRRSDDLLGQSTASDLLLVLTPHPTLPLEEAADCASVVLDTRGTIVPRPHVERL